MIKINVRIDEALHARLQRRAHDADLTLSAFLRRVLQQGADPANGYVFSSQDEILATCIQILSIVATGIGQQSPKALQQGMADARAILSERGLLGRENAR